MSSIAKFLGVPKLFAKHFGVETAFLGFWLGSRVKDLGWDSQSGLCKFQQVLGMGRTFASLPVSGVVCVEGGDM